MTVAVQDSDLAAITRGVHQAVLALREAESRESRLEKNVETAREVTARRRLELGRELVRARALWPQRGPKAKGWGDFLAKLGIEQQRAWEMMKLAGYTEEVSPHGGEIDRVPTLVEAGAKQPPQLRLVPDPEADDGPDIDSIDVPPIVDIDRDTWCTPRELAEKLGKFDLDPCSNERSHIKSRFTYRLDRGEDGLELASEVPKQYRVFVNCPYSRGNVIKWVLAYAHTRFCFLLKFDTSTEWFTEVAKRTAVVCFPVRDRVQFEAPPGVPKDMQIANQFPHGLFYANEDDVSSAIRRSSTMWRRV